MNPPALMVIACAMLVNPMAARHTEAKLDDFIAASEKVGDILSKKAPDALGGRKLIAFGKGVLVDADGDLKQGASMNHYGADFAIRTAVKSGVAMIPGNNKLESPGAPRADEILLAGAFATGQPNARITGVSEKVVHELVAKLKGK